MALGKKLTELQNSMDHYGDLSLKSYRALKPLGEQVIVAFAEYLGEGAEVIGVAPEGDWSARQYRDGKFSTHQSGWIDLDPISMGLAICIPHKKDSGKHWMRVVLTFQMENGEATIGVGDGPIIRNIDLSFPQADKTRISEAIFEYVNGIFADPARYAEAQRLGKIGFGA